MLALIKKLKEEHSLIVSTFEEVKRLKADTKDGQNKLLEAKDILLSHIKREDAEFYPPILMAAEKNKYLKQTLNMFANDMSAISSFVFDFYEQYDMLKTDPDFSNRFEDLVTLLTTRVEREERILFPRYEDLFGQD
jgi:hypothetical protein